MKATIPRLTLYVIPGGGPETNKPFKAAASFFKHMPLMTLHIIDHNDLNDFNDSIQTPWFGYVMSNEWLDDDLSRSIPIFLESGHFDCLVLMQKQVDAEGKARVFEVPRIFKTKNVRIQKWSLMPEHPEKLKYERALNGWLIIGS